MEDRIGIPSPTALGEVKAKSGPLQDLVMVLM